MYQRSDYNVGVSAAPPPDVMDEIETIVKTEVTVISRDIAQQVADRATAELTDRFALKTDVQSLTNTVTSLSNLSGTVASHTAQLTTLNSLATNTSERLAGAGTGAASNAVLGGGEPGASHAIPQQQCNHQ